MYRNENREKKGETAKCHKLHTLSVCAGALAVASHDE